MCAKVSYGYRAAHEVINLAHDRKRSGHKIPQRAYWCHRCKLWHLTSQTYRTQEAEA